MNKLSSLPLAATVLGALPLPARADVA